MFLFLTLVNFVILILFQIIIFRLIKFKKNWHLTTFFIFIVILIFRNKTEFLSVDFFNYIIFNSVILLSYIVFLTLIFNGSPSLFYLNNNDQIDFINRGFVKNRTELMIIDGLIDKQNNITSKGRVLLIISKILSNIFFKEND
jgi:hypothetical protein|tara:strand:- start:1887 stop:2315 length:429 start_codon:yes stop_codon:yes gene_type:complete